MRETCLYLFGLRECLVVICMFGCYLYVCKLQFLVVSSVQYLSVIFVFQLPFLLKALSYEAVLIFKAPLADCLHL